MGMDTDKLAPLDLSVLDRNELDVLAYHLDNAWTATHEKLLEGTAGEILEEIEDIESDVSDANISLRVRQAQEMNGALIEPAVRDAVNKGAELVLNGLGLGGDGRDSDLINLVVNASVHLVRNPDATLDEVITENYQADPEEVRGWWSGW